MIRVRTCDPRDNAARRQRSACTGCPLGACFDNLIRLYPIAIKYDKVEKIAQRVSPAQPPYSEEEHRGEDDVEVVLFGSDSLATLERTHSSYFELSEKHVDQVVARDLAELGLA
jgi:hypothetical protein